MLFDFNDSEATTQAVRQKLPEGVYRVAITSFYAKAEEQKGGFSNAPDPFFIGVNFQVLEGPQKGFNLNYRYRVGSLNDYARKVGKSELKDLLSCFGISGAIEDETDGMRLLANKICYIDFGYRESKGKMYEQIKSYSTAAPVKTTDPDSVEIPF